MNLDVHILYLRYLENSPFKEAAQAIRNELERRLPERLDFLGHSHPQCLQEYLRQFPDIRGDALPNMLQQLKQLVDEKIPPAVRESESLLGSGRQSLLRTEHTLQNQHKLKCIRALRAGKYISRGNAVINIFHSIRARQHIGYMPITQFITTDYHRRPTLYRRLFGHLSAVYCVTFDRTGKFIFTGADDSLIKIWSALDGRLLATLRGHSGEITDLSVSYENTLLASGSVDRFICIWDLQTTKMLHCLSAHHAMITSVKFSPFNKYDKKNRFLISTGNDGCVCFWKYDPITKEFKRPKKQNERIKPAGQMVCSAFTTGGTFLAIGSTDNYVKIYGFFNSEWPWYSTDVELHSDHVDSLQFSHHGLRLVSGSKDGTALIWRFSCQEWKTTTLNMRETLSGEEENFSDEKMSVCMVGWSLDDAYVVTSVSNNIIKVWNSTTGALVHELKGHRDVVYCIENHPQDPRIILTGGHDGQIILWDLEKGSFIKSFMNTIDGQGHAAVLDVKFSSDGHMFAATDTHGNLSLYGYAESDHYAAVPDQVFFQTDYRPLIRDVNNFVLDEQTHLAPHLMAASPLVDMDGNPQPERFQRLVPELNRVAGSLRNVISPLNSSEIAFREKSLEGVMDDEQNIFDLEWKKPKKESLKVAQPRPTSSTRPHTRQMAKSTAPETSSYEIRRSARQTARRAALQPSYESRRSSARQTARRAALETSYESRRPARQTTRRSNLRINSREPEFDRESYRSRSEESDDSDYIMEQRIRRPTARRAARRAQRINYRLAERMNHEEEPSSSSTIIDDGDSTEIDEGL